MALPDFLIAGAPKAGTTALYAALVRHPGLFLPMVKEPKFFLSDGPPPRRGGPGDAQTYQEHVWRRAGYEALFEPAPRGAVRGEATPFYLYDLEAHRRIHRLLPRVRLILVLRDPVDRAHSNWAHLRGAGLERESDFVAACDLEPRRRAAGWAAFWHYVGLGCYGSQVAHLLSVFDREQVLVMRYRDLRDAPAATLDRVCAFLGVQTGAVDHVPRENVRQYAPDTAVNAAIAGTLRLGARFGHHVPVPWREAFSGPLLRLLHRHDVRRPKVTRAQRAALLPRFADEIALLQEVTGESFADWLALDHPSTEVSTPGVF